MRSVLLSNGTLAVLMDADYNLRDLYYPYLGQWNHSFGGRSKFGVWHDGKFTWAEGMEGREVRFGNMESTFKAKWDGLEVEVRDLVSIEVPALVREFHIGGQGMVRVLFYHDLKLNGYEIGDTALYDPSTDALYHYKGSTWFGIASTSRIYEYTTGRRDQNAVLPDCEDGQLSKNPIAQGSVSSAISIAYPEFTYFLVAGRSYQEVSKNLEELRKGRGIRRTSKFWEDVASTLSEPEDDLARTSLLVTLAHVGEGGEIPASLDSDILKFNLDTYAYVWPRDAAWVAVTLDEAGFWSFTSKFYSSMFKSFTADGYLAQKFNPDWTLGSSWHPWTAKTHRSLNFQEDETATVIYGLWRHFTESRDYHTLREVFDVVERAADFMTQFRDERLKLPLESFDLWEERLGVHTYTVASVYAGLRAASNLAKVLGEQGKAEKWGRAAQEVWEAAKAHLFNRERGAFFRTVNVDSGRIVGVDPTLDSSTLGVVLFGLLEPSDPLAESNSRTLEGALWVKGVGGLARYENDYYQRVQQGVPGNPWIITTMWLAQYYALRGELKRAQGLLSWARGVKTSTNLLPEQVNPRDGSPLSVVPLLWSHAEYLRTYLMIRGKR